VTRRYRVTVLTSSKCDPDLRRKTNASYLDEVSTVTAVASGRKDKRVVLGRGQYRNAVASGRKDERVVLGRGQYRNAVASGRKDERVVLDEVSTVTR